MHLIFAGVDVADLAKKVGTPVYVYDEDQAVKNLRRIKEAIRYEPLGIHYAMMCNSSACVLWLLKKAGADLQLNSVQELHLALSACYRPEQISVTTTNIGPEEMMEYARAGVHLNLDSLPELARYGRIAGGFEMARREIGVRLAVRSEKAVAGTTNAPHTEKSRVGICSSQFDKAFDLAKEHGLKIVEVHGYGASNVLDIEHHLSLADQVCEAAKHFPDIQTVNFSAGYGVPMKPDEAEFDWMSYGEGILPLLDSLNEHFGRRIHLKIEPGRSIMATAGALLTKVTNIKEFDSWTEVGVDAGFGVFPRPFIYGWEGAGYHPIVSASRFNEPATETYTVCGNSVLQRDFLGEDRLLPKTEVGDILAILNVGAYGEAMASLYPGAKRHTSVSISSKRGTRLL